MSASSKDGLLALSGSLMGLSTIAVGLRFWARRRYKMRVMADDVFAGLALLSYIGASACVFVMVQDKELGYSSHNFTLEQIAAMARSNEMSQVVHDVMTTNTLACVKLSALFFYRRLFCAGGKIFGAATWVTIVVVFLWLVVFQLLTGFQCGTHFSALWDGSYLRYCTISFPFLYGLVISDFLLDVLILALPIPSILHLHITAQKKMAVIGVFLLAFVGVGASIARMVQYINIELGGPEYLLNNDHEALVTESFFYTMLEAGMALIAVNLPSLRVVSFSLLPGEILRSMRSFLSLSGRSSAVSEAPSTSDTNEPQKRASFSTWPSERSHVQHQDLPSTSVSVVEDPEGQSWVV